MRDDDEVVGSANLRAGAEDYRLAVLMMIMRPVNHAALGIPPVIWWSHLERITAAVDDLGCRDLLD